MLVEMRQKLNSATGNISRDTVFIGEQNCGTLSDISHLAKQKRADTVFYCNFAQVKNQTAARIFICDW